MKSNRLLTEGFTYDGYGEGMDWVEHSGGILGTMYRHLPALRPLTEGVLRGFMPWPEIETFPRRMLVKTFEGTANVFKNDVKTFAVAAAAFGASVWLGAIAPATVQ